MRVGRLVLLATIYRIGACSVITPTPHQHLPAATQDLPNDRLASQLPHASINSRAAFQSGPGNSVWWSGSAGVHFVLPEKYNRWQDQTGILLQLAKWLLDNDYTQEQLLRLQFDYAPALTGLLNSVQPQNGQYRGVIDVYPKQGVVQDDESNKFDAWKFAKLALDIKKFCEGRYNIPKGKWGKSYTHAENIFSHGIPGLGEYRHYNVLASWTLIAGSDDVAFIRAPDGVRAVLLEIFSDQSEETAHKVVPESLIWWLEFEGYAVTGLKCMYTPILTTTSKEWRSPGLWRAAVTIVAVDHGIYDENKWIEIERGLRDWVRFIYAARTVLRTRDGRLEAVIPARTALAQLMDTYKTMSVLSRETWTDSILREWHMQRPYADPQIQWTYQ